VHPNQDRHAAFARPGGTMVIATWCQREETPEAPFTEAEKAELQFLYDEWAHPFFVSIEEYARIMEVGAGVGGGGLLRI
jgi:MPBQ/MSBQ methyltransferase